MEFKSEKNETDQEKTYPLRNLKHQARAYTLGLAVGFVVDETLGMEMSDLENVVKAIGAGTFASILIKYQSKTSKGRHYKEFYEQSTKEVFTQYTPHLVAGVLTGSIISKYFI